MRSPAREPVREDDAAAAAADLRRTFLFLGGAMLLLPFSEGVFNLPLKILLKDHLHLRPLALAVFMGISGFSWGTKPLAGLLTDRFRLFGTRRRHYLLVSIVVALLGGALLGVSPLAFAPLLLAHVVLNVGVVFATVVGYGLLVEKGQRYNATGDLSALQLIAGSVGAILVGVVSGFLVARSLFWASGVSCVALGILLCLAYRTVREPRSAVFADGARTATLHSAPLFRTFWEAVVSEYRVLAGSSALLSTAVMLFLFYIAPGFGTLLLYHQTDTLHFSPRLIGNLDAVGAAAGIAGGAVYPLLSRRFRLGPLLAAGIVVSAVSSLLYLGYQSPLSAAGVQVVHGFLSGTLTVLPLYDLAARATPRAGAGLGYSLILSVRNIASAVSDWLGAALYQHLHLTFTHMVWINAGTTLLALAALPFLPLSLRRVREGAGDSGS